MAIEIKVPEMGESITEATLISWTKKIGDAVEADEVLAELETDKVTMEVRAPSKGILQELNKQVGDVVRVREVIGKIEESSDGVKTIPTQTHTPATNEVSTTPSARKMLAENHLKPEDVEGTGRRGLVTKPDVIAHLEKKNVVTTTTTTTSSFIPSTNSPTEKKIEQIKTETLPASQKETIVPMTRLRRAIAERLVSAQRTAAILTTFNEIDMSAIMNLRTQYKDKYKESHNVSIGFMGFFTKAAIAALKAFPVVNAEIRDNNIVYKHYYDIGIAVGGPKGLVVPVVRNADQKSILQIEQDIVKLAGKVRDGSIALEELQGGTFTISNGGVYGSMMSTPILNPPQVGILGLHNIVKRPVVVNDEIVVRPMMYVALSYDHRIIDGKEAVQFLVKIKECMEEPNKLLLEA